MMKSKSGALLTELCGQYVGQFPDHSPFLKQVYRTLRQCHPASVLTTQKEVGFKGTVRDNLFVFWLQIQTTHVVDWEIIRTFEI